MVKVLNLNLWNYNNFEERKPKIIAFIKPKTRNIIATNNFFYGQFFFDEVFMDILKRKAQTIRADAIIFERDRKDYPNYNEDYLYFTAIQYID